MSTTNTQKKERSSKPRTLNRIEKTPDESPIGDTGSISAISYTEAEAAAELNIPLEDLQWLRKAILEHGPDYIREVPSGIVRITQDGMCTLAGSLAEGRTLIVTGTSIPNPQLVLAKLPGGTDVMRVRVADRDAWCRGMVIQEAIPTDNPKIWSTMIRPQFKGRA